MLVLNEQELQAQAQDEFLMGILKKFDSQESLTEDDIEFLAHEFDDCIAYTKDDESSRWDFYRTLVINIQNRYFIFGYSVGLTESQDNDYSDTDFDEVIGTETEKVIIDVKWDLVNPKEPQKPIAKF